MRLFAVAGAAHHYETARVLLNENKVEVEPVTCQHLYTRLGKAYELEFRHRKALDVYEEMQVQASIRKNRRMELAAMVARCIILPMPYETQDVKLARELAGQALPLAQALDNIKAQAEIEMSLARTYKFGDGQMEAAIPHFRAAEGLARKAGLREQLGFATLELGVAFMWRDQLEQAEATLLESMEIYRELDQRPRVLSCLHNLAIIYMETGRFEAALNFMREAYRANEALGSSTSVYALATTHNVIHILRGEYVRAFEALLPALEMDETQIVPGLWTDIFQQLAWCYCDLGAYDEGLHHCQKAVAHHRHTSFIGRAPAFAILALLQIRRGDLNEAEFAVKKGWENFDLQSQTYPGWWETLSILEAEAELALAKGELNRAKRCAEQLLAKYEELNLRHLKPGILYLRAEIELATGKKENAYQTLSEALTLSNEMGIHRDMWAICSMLGKLEAERGNELASVQLHERACEEAMFIAGHAGTPEMREIFLSRTDVQLILSV